MIGSDQAARPEGLDDVRAYGVRCCAPPFDPPWFGVLRELRCSRWAGGLRVIAVEPIQSRRGEHLVVTVESGAGPMGCPRCGALARSHGRRIVELIHTPCFGRPVRVRWRKRTWTCPEEACRVGTFTEQDEQVAAARRC